MKKFLIFALCILMVMPMVLVGCGDTPETPETPETPKMVKFGSGVYVGTPAMTDANAADEVDGTGSVDLTFAAVTVDADGKIAACELDTASNSVKFTADGKAIANAEFKTKYELGASYNMVTYGQAIKEWFEQADAFETVVVGKTIAEVKALIAEENKGTDEVVTAGCTIKINEFVAAIEKAYAAATTEIAADAKIKVAIATEQTCTDAAEDKDGSNKVSMYVFASATDAAGKIVAASSDCVEVAFTFTAEGVATLDTAKAIASKKEQGNAYGMVAYGQAAKEWFEQAAAFDAACIGKTPAEIAGLMAEDGKGVEALQTAGCTIYVTGFVKAATK